MQTNLLAMETMVSLSTQVWWVFCFYLFILKGLPGGSVAKNLPVKGEGMGSNSGRGRPLGEGNGNQLQYTCPEVPWTEEPGTLQSMGLQRVKHDWATKYTFIFFWKCSWCIIYVRGLSEWVSESHSVVSDSVRPHRWQPTRLPVPGILQARTLEWVAISFSNAWKWKGKVKSLSRVWLLATPWAAVYQAPPSMGFSRQEYWSRVPTI